MLFDLPSPTVQPIMTVEQHPVTFCISNDRLLHLPLDFKPTVIYPHLVLPSLKYLSWHPFKQAFAVTDGDTISIKDLSMDQYTICFKHDHCGNVSCVEFNSTGQLLLASGGSYYFSHLELDYIYGSWSIRKMS